jgi:membrane-associated phospholipid phosphatase
MVKADPPNDLWKIMKQTFRAWCLWFALTVIVVAICFWWIDRPVSLWVHSAIGWTRVPVELSGSRILSIPNAAAAVFVVLGLLALGRRQFSMVESALALSVISTLITLVIKDQLKVLFGRTWPETWGPGILSFVQNNVYGFHYFQAGPAFESFPSGHAAVAAAFLSVIWLLFPRLRVVSTLGIIAADLGLVLFNLHFLSDVIAGSFVGISIGLFTVALWRMINVRDAGRQKLPEPK